MSIAWRAVLLLFPVALLNYLDRQMLASMKFSVMADIPSIGSDAVWGMMLGQFKWVYAVLSPLGGLVADRFGHRLTISASLLAWSIVTWLTGQAETVADLALARTFMGVSEAFYIPAALALISAHHGPATRSRATGVHQMAIYCGVILGGFGGYAADSPDIGWRGAFSAAGIVGAVYAVPLYLSLGRIGSAREHTAAPQEPSARALLSDLRTLLTRGSFILLVICFTLPAMPAWIVRDWMPAVLKSQFGIGQGMAGVSATLYFNIAALGGAVLGGWLADRLTRRTARGRILVSAMGIFLLAPAMFGVGFAPTLFVAICFLALFGLGWGFFDCNNMPILCQIAPPRLRATGYGIMNFVSISCGGVADVVFGRLQDARVPLAMSFGAFALVTLLAVGCMLDIRPRPDADG